MAAFSFCDSDDLLSSWRRAGRSGIDALALLLPLDLADTENLTPGIRLLSGVAQPTAPQLAELAHVAPIETLSCSPHRRIVLSLWPKVRAQGGDCVRLVEARLSDDEWRFRFHLWRRTNPNLEPAAARLCILLALLFDDAAPRKLSFYFSATELALLGREAPLAAFETAPLELALTQ